MRCGPIHLGRWTAGGGCLYMGWDAYLTRALRVFGMTSGLV